MVASAQSLVAADEGASGAVSISQTWEVFFTFAPEQVWREPA